MKIGDVLIHNNDSKWIIFDISNEFIYVMDFESQKIGEVLVPNFIKEHIAVEENVSWLFIEKRSRNLKDLEMYL